jgi:hypothetical protein
VEAEDRGFAYYTLPHHPIPPLLRDPAVVALGNVSVLSLPRGNDTWSVTVFGGSGDAPLKALHDPAVFTRVVEACPLQILWLDGAPITDVLPMAGGADSAPPVRGRRTVRGHRIRRRRQRLFVHQPVGRAWAIGRCGGRLGAAPGSCGSDSTGPPSSLLSLRPSPTLAQPRSTTSDDATDLAGCCRGSG